jgi:sulfate/thiosulfate transport system permease protein
MASVRARRRSIIPGFGMTLGFTLFYLSLIVLIPLSATFFETAKIGWHEFWRVAVTPRALAAYGLSFGAALVAATLNFVLGTLVAWVLVRYDFPLKRVLDSIVDLPFALPTAVAGIALTTLYAVNGWFGAPLAAAGVHVAFTRLGIVVALTFVGLPFVVRTVQPVLEDLDKELEEAAASLGAGRWQTFARVVYPAIFLAALTGFALAFARGVGEYGSVIFIAGNMPMKTEIAPLLIVTKLEEYDYTGATAIAVVMLVVSFILLLAINMLQRWTARHEVALVSKSAPLQPAVGSVAS